MNDDAGRFYVDRFFSFDSFVRSSFWRVKRPCISGIYFFKSWSSCYTEPALKLFLSIYVVKCFKILGTYLILNSYCCCCDKMIGEKIPSPVNCLFRIPLLLQRSILDVRSKCQSKQRLKHLGTN